MNEAAEARDVKVAVSTRKQSETKDAQTRPAAPNVTQGLRSRTFTLGRAVEVSKSKELDSPEGLHNSTKHLTRFSVMRCVYKKNCMVLVIESDSFSFKQEIFRWRSPKHFGVS